MEGVLPRIVRALWVLLRMHVTRTHLSDYQYPPHLQAKYPRQSDR